MKKKAIENISYLTLPKVCSEPNVEYVAVTGIKIVNHEKHLFVEVYRNDLKHMEIPVARIVLSKNDFGTFLPDSNTWSQRQINRDDGSIWRRGTGENRFWAQKDRDILHSEDDRKRIENFVGKQHAWKSRTWWNCIQGWQESIAREKYRKKAVCAMERRQNALKDREAHTPLLPEQRVLQYADESLFNSAHYLFYKKHGSTATVACTSCGGVTTERWKAGESYESQYMVTIQEPREGYFGICPLCQKSGKYVPQGRTGNRLSRGWLFLGQKYKDTGMVFRCIEVGKRWHSQLIDNGQGPELLNASEEISGVEIIRAYFEPDKKVQLDFQKHNPFSGTDFWDDCNLSGMHHIRVPDGRIMPETFVEMKGTYLQYSALQEFFYSVRVINPIEYLRTYIQLPQIEMLVKLGLIETVREIMRTSDGIVEDPGAKRVDTFLGIQKEHIRLLIHHQGDVKVLRVLQLEKTMRQLWSDEQIEQLKEIFIERLQNALQYMTVQQFLNRVSKYAGCGYGTKCFNAQDMLKHTAVIYRDYLEMRTALGYDMHNSIYLHPRCLEEAHAKVTIEIDKKQADERMREVEMKFPMIKKHYRRLRKKFFYEDEEYLIRPVRSAQEIVREGRTLHHCVGGDDYLNEHNREESIILFLRVKKMPEVPYVTVEISNQQLVILQWYGAHDKKPDKKHVQEWLDNYVARLQSSGKNAEPKEIRIKIGA